jgi:hypothetical protein
MATVVPEKTSLCLPVKMEKSNGVNLGPPDKDVSNTPLHLPEWFFQNCVKTSEELNEHNLRLIVRNNSHSSSKRTSLPARMLSNSEIYEIESTMYDKLNDIVSFNGSSETQGLNKPSIDGKNSFANDGAMLRFPDDTKSLPFLSVVVEYFSKDIGADLITMSFEDFEDLCEHFAVIQRRKKCNDVDCHIKSYFDQDHPSKDKEDSSHIFEDKPEPEPEQATYEWADYALSSTKKSKKGKRQKKAGWVDVEVNLEEVNIETENSQAAQNDPCSTIDEKAFPFSLILRSTTTKRESEQDSSSRPEHYQPLVVHIRGVHRFMEDKIRHSILIQFRDYVQKWTERGHVLLIATDCNSGSDPYHSSLKDSSILGTIGRNPARRVTRIVPVKSRAQISLLKVDEGREIERENIRKLQRKIRQYHSIDKNSFLLQPNTSWSLDEGGLASTLLRKKVLDGDEVEEAANSISRKLEVSHIEKVLMQVDKNTKALDNWQLPSEDDRWLSFPLKAQEVIAEIESKKSEYSYEHDMLSLLVNPGKFCSSPVQPFA